MRHVDEFAAQNKLLYCIGFEFWTRRLAVKHCTFLVNDYEEARMNANLGLLDEPFEGKRSGQLICLEWMKQPVSNSWLHILAEHGAWRMAHGLLFCFKMFLCTLTPILGEEMPNLTTSKEVTTLTTLQYFDSPSWLKKSQKKLEISVCPKRDMRKKKVVVSSFFSSRKLGKWPNLTVAYFSKRLVQPPTRTYFNKLRIHGQCIIYIYMSISGVVPLPSTSHHLDFCSFLGHPELNLHLLLASWEGLSNPT